MSRLPESYAEVDFISTAYEGGTGSGSSGSQIDTGLTFDMNNDWAEITFRSFTNQVQQNGMILANSNTSNHFWLYHYNSGPGLCLYIQQNGSQNLINSSNIPVDDKKHTFLWQNKQMYLDGSLKGSDTRSLGTTNTNLYIGSRGNDYFYKGEIYRCKIWKSGVIVRDFVPCYRKSDKKPGLFDIINNKFYTNSGTYDFRAGPRLIEPAFLAHGPIKSKTISHTEIQTFSNNCSESVTRWTSTSTSKTVSCTLKRGLIFLMGVSNVQITNVTYSTTRSVSGLAIATIGTPTETALRTWKVDITLTKNSGTGSIAAGTITLNIYYTYQDTVTVTETVLYTDTYTEIETNNQPFQIGTKKDLSEYITFDRAGAYNNNTSKYVSLPGYCTGFIVTIYNSAPSNLEIWCYAEAGGSNSESSMWGENAERLNHGWNTIYVDCSDCIDVNEEGHLYAQCYACANNDESDLQGFKRDFYDWEWKA